MENVGIGISKMGKRKLRICVSGCCVLVFVGAWIYSVRLKSPPLTSGSMNDAELILTRCGPPDSDKSTENEQPRPMIPTRLIEYRRQGVKLVFAPGRDFYLSAPPPYHWHLLGVRDLHTLRGIPVA